MGTDVTYNTVLLRNVVTRQWDQEIVYDDSGTDVIRQVFHLRFDGLLYLSYQGGGVQTLDTTPNIIPPSGGPNISSLYAGISKKLSEARGDLTVTMNGEIILRCIGQGASTADDIMADADNGPKPHHVAITHVAGNKVFRVSFSIDVCLGQTSTYEQQNVLNNRWSVGETIDDNWFTTRTIRGRMRLSNESWWPQAFRSVVLPPLETGFRRQTIDYVTSSNELDVDYVVIDKQVSDAAPWPATKITGTFGESTVDGIQYMTDLHLRLDGSPNSDKRMMLVRGVQIAQQKMEIVVPDQTVNQQSVGYRVLNAALIEHIGDANAVEVHFTIMHLKPNPKEYLTNLWSKWLGTPLTLPPVNGEPAPYDVKVSRLPAQYGYTPHTPGNRTPALLNLLSCYLQVPEGDHAIYNPGNNDTPPDNTSQGQPTITGVQLPGPIPNSTGDSYSAAAYDSMYTHAAAETRYVQHNQICLGNTNTSIYNPYPHLCF